LTRKLIIITAPSGSGKTTLVKRLLVACPNLAFSVSACTRRPRSGEIDGKDYYFFNEEKFKELIAGHSFVEWEMVYPGKYYGTLNDELHRIWDSGKTPLVDIDVQGALAIRDKYPDISLTIFIEAPSLEELRRRLVHRGTETEANLNERVAKAANELTFAQQFDRIIINEHLNEATGELIKMTEEFLAF
jgi:guanylate kinase